LCLEPFDLLNHKPYKLHCSHTFCLKSIKELFNYGDGQIKCQCPLCRRITKVNSIDEIKKDSVMIDKMMLQN